MEKETLEKLVEELLIELKLKNKLTKLNNEISAEEIREHQRFTCLKIALKANAGGHNEDYIPLAKKFHTYITTGE